MHHPFSKRRYPSLVITITALPQTPHSLPATKNILSPIKLLTFPFKAEFVFVKGALSEEPLSEEDVLVDLGFEVVEVVNCTAAVVVTLVIESEVLEVDKLDGEEEEEDRVLVTVTSKERLKVDEHEVTVDPGPDTVVVFHSVTGYTIVTVVPCCVRVTVTRPVLVAPPSPPLPPP